MSQSARKSIRHVLFCQESYRQSPLFGDALSCPETAFKQGAKGHQQKLILKVFSGKIVRQKYPFCSDTEPWCALFVPKRPSNTTQQGTTRGVATARGRSSAGAFLAAKPRQGVATYHGRGQRRRVATVTPQYNPNTGNTQPP